MTVSKRQSEVEALRIQLQNAEDALADAKINLASIKDEEKRLPGIINGIRVRLDGLREDLIRCENMAATIQAKIDSLDPEDLTSQIAELEDAIL